jgi:hypothetical protein
MLTRKRYRLISATLAIENRGDKRIAITLMEGEIVEVIRGPRPDDTPDGGHQMERQRARLFAKRHAPAVFPPMYSPQS